MQPVDLDDYARQCRVDHSWVRRERGWTQLTTWAAAGEPQGITEFSLLELELLARGLETPVEPIIESTIVPDRQK